MSVLNFPSVPSNGQIYEGYIWVASESVWNLLPIDSAQGFTQLAGVDITSPSVGDALVYDGTDWVNQVPATPDALTRADLPAGSVLQVVSTTKTDAFTVSLTGGSFSSNVTGLTVNITPISTSSKIMVIVSLSTSSSRQGSSGFFRMTRDTSPISVPTSAGSRRLTTSMSLSAGDDSASSVNLSANFVDSPATTSEITYGVQLLNAHSVTYNIFVNRTEGDGDTVFNPRSVSTITVMEVAG